MFKHDVRMQQLLSLPPRMAAEFGELEGRALPEWFATCDPAGSKLGSGGGTAHVLAEGWRATGGGEGFGEWLRGSRKLILHAGGQSRRLPAYAGTGKLLLPVPVFRWARGQRLDQSLLDLQLPDYQRVLAHAGQGTVAMVTSGDVLLRFGSTLPAFPQVDVLGLGMWVTPERARDFGVFFSKRERPEELSFFLQKPSAARIRELAGEYLYLVDTGMWLLSERAVAVLMGKCGWDDERQEFAAGGVAGGYELYAQMGLALGKVPAVVDTEVNGLTSAVVPLPAAEFYHFGTSRQLIESITALQNLELDERKLGLMGARRHPNQYLQNSQFSFPLRQEENHTLWVENSTVPKSWQLASEHVLTGVPENGWDLKLEAGVCLDFVPVVGGEGDGGMEGGGEGERAGRGEVSPNPSSRCEPLNDPPGGALSIARHDAGDAPSGRAMLGAPVYREGLAGGASALVCVRCYGMNDLFSGAVGEATTRWLDRPAPNWFFARGISREAAGIEARCDIQRAKLFPVVRVEELEPRFIEWLFAAKPVRNEEFARRWLALPRLSAEEIGERVDLRRVYEQRRRNRRGCLLPMWRNGRWSVFYKLDLESTARMWAESGEELPAEGVSGAAGLERMQEVHDRMFRGAVLRHRGLAGGEAYERGAFGLLHEMVVREAQLSPASPRRAAQEDQIVWGRSPVRLDLAGGWTDTPPYCLEYGGKVVNVAVDLNGQPPIQVFAKLIERRELVLRSIDQGNEERVTTYEQLDRFGQPDTEFALAKAALALAGFLPRFHGGGGRGTLAEQLGEFGGGIELSMLSAVPKGSGLGTSSILAATLLATLGDVCGLGWGREVLFARTLALEQMLTTGGGWQDQAGAIFRGMKLIETSPGLEQRPTLRWLPEHLFESEHANRTILLYYTGITRLAKNILYEIVRGIFLNSPEHLRVIGEIAGNAELAFSAIQRCERGALEEAVGNSWALNQRLDAGTNPPAVQAILGRIGDYVAACKLLGAGGGGYLLLLAKDEVAAERLRRELTENPPNARARFVQFGVSRTGLQLTRS